MDRFSLKTFVSKLKAPFEKWVIPRVRPYKMSLDNLIVLKSKEAFWNV